MAQGKKEAAAKLKYLKRELKDLERSFEKEHGRAPSQADLTDEQRAKYDEYKRLKHGTGKEGDDGEGGEEERHRIEREEHENLRSERRRLFAESLKSLTRKQALRVQSKLHNYPPELREAAAEALDERLARNDGEANNAKGPEAPPTKAARPRDGSSTDDGEEMEKELRNDGDDGALDGPGAYGEGEKLPFGALGLGLSEDDDGVANP